MENGLTTWTTRQIQIHLFRNMKFRIKAITFYHLRVPNVWWWAIHAFVNEFFAHNNQRPTAQLKIPFSSSFSNIFYSFFHLKSADFQFRCSSKFHFNVIFIPLNSIRFFFFWLPIVIFMEIFEFSVEIDWAHWLVHY